MDQFTLKVANQDLYTFAIVYARKQGVPVYSETYRDRETDFTAYPKLNYDGHHLVGAKYDSFSIISFEQFIEWCDNFQRSMLPLNRNYTAQIDFGKEVVNVGCQSFPFKKVEELYNLIKAGTSK